MSAGKVIASYLRVAAEDLAGAKVLAMSGNRNAIYLCSQAAEKVIRAVLTSENVHGGIGHQFDQMVNKSPDENPIKGRLRQLEVLSQFTTSFRYPTVAGRVKQSPKSSEFDQHAIKVQEALTEAVTRLGVDLANEHSEAKQPGPIR